MKHISLLVVILLFGLGSAQQAKAQGCTPNVNACVPTNPAYPFCFTPEIGATGYTGVPYNETIFVNVKSQYQVQGFTVYLSKLVFKTVEQVPPGLQFTVNSGNPADVQSFANADTIGVLTIPDTTTTAAVIGMFGCVSVFGTPTQANIGPGTIDNDTVNLVVDVYIRFELTGDDLNPNSLNEPINPLRLYYKVPIKQGLAVTAAGDAQIVCGGDTPLSATSNVPNVTYSWSPTTGLDNPNTANPTASPTQTTTYTVTITDADGQQGAATVTVTVDQSGVAQPTATGAERCGPGQVQLTAAGGTEYRWYDAATGGNLVGTGAILTLPNAAQTKTYYVANTPGGTCESARVPVVVTINPLPDVTFTTNPPLTANIVDGDIITFTSAANSGENVVWYFGDNNSDTGASVTYGYSLPGTYTAKLVVTNTKGCSDSTTFTVDIKMHASIDNLADKGVFTLYPNPTTDAFTLRYDGMAGAIRSIAILNALGQTVAQPAAQNAPQQTVSVAQLPAGLYQVRIDTEKGVGTLKILVQ